MFVQNAAQRNKDSNDMATAGNFLNEEQLECPICTDFFKNPVSLPCGHNFCDACINRHWKDKRQQFCPLCKQEVDKSLKLCVNTLFRDIVDGYKQDGAVGDSEKPVSAEDVLCDCCLPSRRRAAQTCLVCLTSFCETHLEPHLRVTALNKHTLTGPVPKLEEKTCTKHNRILEEDSDGTPVCALCVHETQGQSGKKCNDYIKIKNPKKKKTKPRDVAPKPTLTENNDETETSENIHIWYNNIMYTFSPLPLESGFSSGRVYYDVPIETDCDWDLGVVNENLRGYTFSTKPCGRWVVRCHLIGWLIWGSINNGNIPDRICVCVDYKQGLMFLVHPLDGSVVFYLTNCRFKGKLFLFTQKAGEPFVYRMRDFISAKWRWDYVLICIALPVVLLVLSVTLELLRS